ncbi:hypothetical protein IMF23_17460 [Chelatococcus daeguensis]|uniref:hypothetical protein n=1 Tax=Chelatococcus TaxID=28209 RepID=UPI000AC90D1C|nr:MULTISPECIES: hypothetical protein [Chelatococcus]MBM3085232.1 hypothetical protein [Chelatococcus daeguensis]
MGFLPAMLRVLDGNSEGKRRRSAGNGPGGSSMIRKAGEKKGSAEVFRRSLERTAY